MDREDDKCIKCNIGKYVHHERKEKLRGIREVTIVSDICDNCGHDYYDEMARLAEECYQASEKEM